MYTAEMPIKERKRLFEMSQNDVVLKYLKKHKSITSEKAKSLGVSRLSARIFDLRKSGNSILAEPMPNSKAMKFRLEK